MADSLRTEIFKNAVIDLSDGTITEYKDDRVSCYDIQQFLKRWDGVIGVTITIQREIPLPPDGRG